MNNSDITLVVVVFLALISGGGYLYLNQNNKHNNKTLKNKKAMKNVKDDESDESDESDENENSEDDEDSVSESDTDVSYLDIDVGNLEDKKPPKRKYTKRNKK